MSFNVPIEGGKYKIVQDGKGEMTIERFGEVWIDNPQAPKMLVSIAFELAVLRRITKLAKELVEAGNSPTKEKWHIFSAKLADLEITLANGKGYCDYEQNLSNPGEI